VRLQSLRDTRAIFISGLSRVRALDSKRRLTSGDSQAYI